MGIVKAVHSKASIGKAIDYIEENEKTNIALVDGLNCNPETAISEMKLTKELWQKTDGRQYDHYIHSFAPGENVSPEIAQEIALQWAKEHFSGHETVVATHIDRHHIHSHIIVNSVSFETGIKLHTSAKWLEEAKEHCNDLCSEYGFKAPEKGLTFEGDKRTEAATFKTRQFRTIQRKEKHIGKSYFVDMGISVLNAIDNSSSKEDFINSMIMDGYAVEWTDTRKNIVLKDCDGHKVRLSTLGNTFNQDFSKERIEYEFKRRENTRTKVKDAGEEYVDWGRELNFAAFANQPSTAEKFANTYSSIGSAADITRDSRDDKAVFRSNIQPNRGDEDRSR